MPRNPYFQFKQFRIVQERSAMKVGMDGVLLGAWTDPSGAERILDIGTGTGLIVLMMAQKNASAQIDAIEVDPEALQEATVNIQQSAWSDRINAKLCSFQDFAAQTDQNYDLIVSNPPFFTNGVKAPIETRAQARHAETLPLDVLISGAANMLSENGRIALVLPIESLQEIENLAQSNSLFISRLCRVKPNPQKPVFRILIELTNSECIFQEGNLIIEFEKHHDYTLEYKELTKDFYLKF
ncbi:MAG TPA: tRNA (adenosine(37)-N6)-methyltransferase TrmM [Prolixibacteraceae bacterium]|nr:tRNA (adenosine(37)-N6)-methyltransferase TrmM [Prolixibacteraceae bacterium]